MEVLLLVTFNFTRYSSSLDLYIFLKSDDEGFLLLVYSIDLFKFLKTDDQDFVEYMETMLLTYRFILIVFYCASVNLGDSNNKDF